MMTINKFIKYTSLLFLGLWMVTTPGYSFAANEKVEQETANFSQVKLSDGTALAKGKQLKANIAEYTAKRNKIKAEYEAARKEFSDMHAQGRKICIRAFKARIKALGKDIGEEMSQAAQKLIDDLMSDKSTWDKIKSTVSGVFDLGVSYFKGELTVAWEAAKSILGAVIDEAMNLANSFFDADLHLAAVYQAQSMSEKCRYDDTSAADLNYFAELQKKAKKVDDLANQLSYMPETIDSDATLMFYQTYAGLDENGNPIYIDFYYLLGKDGTLTSISGVTAGCIPLPAKLAEARSCIFCPLFKTIFNAAQNMATQSYATLARPLSNVILIAFALLIAFKVLSNVSSFTKQDAPKFITELLVNMFKVLFAFYMLKSSTIVYEYIIGPVLKAGFEFGASLLFEKGSSYYASCAMNTKGVQVGIMPSYLYSNLDCFIQAVQAEVSIPQSIGSTLMCVARNVGKNNAGPVRNLLWDFGMMFQGLAIWVMGWIMSLAFAFYLIDATIQLGIIGALMPFLVACWPFKATKTYTSKGWSMFMNTFFVYVFMGLVVSVNVQLLSQSLSGGNGGFDAIMKALNGNEVQKLKDLLDIGFSGFLVFIACCLFAFKLTGQASDLAGSMGHGSSTNIGSRIGGLAYNAATKGVQGGAKFGLKTIQTASDKTGLTGKLRQGKDWLTDRTLGMVGLGRRSGKAGNATARRSQAAAALAATAAGLPPVPPLPGGSGGSASDTVAQSHIKKMTQSGRRPQDPTVPNQQTPPTGDAASRTQQSSQQNGRNTEASASNHSSGDGSRTANTQQTQQSQGQEQLRQQLENDYNNTANGRAGQQMIQNQTAEVARNQRVENDAQNKMNYHNRRANEYLQKAERATEPAQKQNFENLANAQFNEAVKAEAAYNKAKADTQRAQAELNNVKQENERYKNEYIRTEMNRRRATQ